jgi:hypothetical protein
MYIGHAVLGMNSRVRELSLFSPFLSDTWNELEFRTGQPVLRYVAREVK